MDDSVATTAILLFWGGVGIGLPLGGLVGWRLGFSWGMGVGGLIIGLGGLAGAGHLAYYQLRYLSGATEVQGVLVGFERETVRDSKGRSSATRAPLVRYRDADGAVHEVRGLGGGMAGKQPGDAVPVRYRPEAPGEAQVGDFQNLWGGVWALSLFGMFPLLAGVFGIAGGFSSRTGTGTPAARGQRPPHPARGQKGRPLQAKGAPAARRPTSPAVGKRVRHLTIAGNLTLVVAIVVVPGLPDQLAHGIGACFSLVAVGCGLHFAAQMLRNRGDWRSGAILLILAIMFLMFGVGVWLLGG